MKTFIIIPNWNGADWLRPCLQSLLKQTAKAKVVVVDNGSADESVQIVKNEFKDVHLIKNSRNLGFTGGVNTGIKYALKNGAEYIALFNSDAVADPGWLESLLKAAKTRPEAGIITGKFLTLKDKQTIDSTGEHYSIWGTPFPRGRGEKDKGQYDSPNQRFVPAATGGASLYRAKLFREIGLFDERFFLYYEDVDISLRAQLAGWKVLYEHSAIAYHKMGGSSGRVADLALYHMYKNFVYLFTKNMPWRLFWRYGWRIKGVYLFKNLQLLKKLKLGLLLKLNLVVLVNLPGVLIDRMKIQSHRQVSVEYFDSLLTHSPPPTQAGLIKLTKKLGIK